MTTLSGHAARIVPTRALIWLFHLALPLAGLGLLVANPAIDVRWEDHGAHFGLILAVALINVGLALIIGWAADERGDARLFLVALAFLSAAGFFAIHALATPFVLLATPNASFVLSTPVGIVLAGAFGLASAFDRVAERAASLLRRRAVLIALAAVALLGWTVLSVLPGAALGQPLPPNAAQPILRVLAAIGIVLQLGAAAGYLRLYRRRSSVVLISIVTAFVLLAEALLAVAESRSWQASWWLWHVLLLLAFGYVAYSAHVQYRREGRATTLFAALSVEETVRRIQDEYRQALEGLVAAIDRGPDVGGRTEVAPIAAQLGERFGLTEGQADVLAQAAEALAVERREVRRLGLFRHYLSPEVAAALLADPTQAALGGATVEVTVLFADLRGFTPFSERSDPEGVVELLNTYFGVVVPIILGVGGTVVQFVGDAIMAIFNAPVRQPDHPLRAARAALRFQRRVGEIAAAHPDWPRFRVGIATGPAMVGNVGSDDVRSFTAIGDTVNLAARLQTAADEGSVVVSPMTAERLAGIATLRPLGGLELKGKSAPVAAQELLDLKEPPADSRPGHDGPGPLR